MPVLPPVCEGCKWPSGICSPAPAVVFYGLAHGLAPWIRLIIYHAYCDVARVERLVFPVCVGNGVWKRARQGRVRLSAGLPAQMVRQAHHEREGRSDDHERRKGSACPDRQDCLDSFCHDVRIQLSQSAQIRKAGERPGADASATGSSERRVERADYGRLRRGLARIAGAWVAGWSEVW